ncbi:MAG: hypothetical protein JSR79_02890 [Proteobacteria bacterium]|nr:hypothetical protein [Pseudomonadota bacterium]
MYSPFDNGECRKVGKRPVKYVAGSGKKFPEARTRAQAHAGAEEGGPHSRREPPPTIPNPGDAE